MRPALEQRPQRPGLGTWNAYVERGTDWADRTAWLPMAPHGQLLTGP